MQEYSTSLGNWKRSTATVHWTSSQTWSWHKRPETPAPQTGEALYPKATMGSGQLSSQEDQREDYLVSGQCGPAGTVRSIIHPQHHVNYTHPITQLPFGELTEEEVEILQ